MKDNYLFLKEVKNLVEKTNCELKVCFQYMNRGDRWIQVRPPGWEDAAQDSGQKRRLSVSTLAPSCSARVNSMSDRTCAYAQGLNTPGDSLQLLRGAEGCETNETSVLGGKGRPYDRMASLWSAIRQNEANLQMQYGSQVKVFLAGRCTQDASSYVLKRGQWVQAHAGRAETEQGCVRNHGHRVRGGTGQAGWVPRGPLGSRGGSSRCPHRMKSSLATSRPRTKASPWCWTPPETEA